MRGGAQGWLLVSRQRSVGELASAPVRAPLIRASRRLV
jgi:hypothetical protein